MVGPHSKRVAQAFKLAKSKNQVLMSVLMYMELAEMGVPAASLNAGLILDKYPILEASESYFASDVKHEDQTTEFDLNKYLAYNHFKMGIHHNDTKAESMLKLGDFNYYGLAPLNKQQPLKAAQIYKWVEQNTDDAELKGQALFNLGMIYHFGFKDKRAKS